LYSSDGTTISLVADIVPGPGSSNPFKLTTIDDHVYFFACTEAAGCEPWVTNGVDVVPLGDIRPGVRSSTDLRNISGPNFVAQFGLVLFRADDGTGSELWAAPQAVFLDGFESGDTDGWSTTVP
jgi:ELWxxDGT repeat protein